MSINLVLLAVVGLGACAAVAGAITVVAVGLAAKRRPKADVKEA
jgi:hypothetical protein